MDRTIAFIKVLGTVLGTALTTYGVFDGETWQSVVGAIVVLVTAGYSVFTAKKEVPESEAK